MVLGVSIRVSMSGLCRVEAGVFNFKKKNKIFIRRFRDLGFLRFRNLGFVKF